MPPKQQLTNRSSRAIEFITTPRKHDYVRFSQSRYHKTLLCVIGLLILAIPATAFLTDRLVRAHNAVGLRRDSIQSQAVNNEAVVDVTEVTPPPNGSLHTGQRAVLGMQAKKQRRESGTGSLPPPDAIVGEWEVNAFGGFENWSIRKEGNIISIEAYHEIVPGVHLPGKNNRLKAQVTDFYFDGKTILFSVSGIHKEVRESYSLSFLDDNRLVGSFKLDDMLLIESGTYMPGIDPVTYSGTATLKRKNAIDVHNPEVPSIDLSGLERQVSLLREQVNKNEEFDRMQREIATKNGEQYLTPIAHQIARQKLIALEHELNNAKSRLATRN